MVAFSCPHKLLHWFPCPRVWRTGIDWRKIHWYYLIQQDKEAVAQRCSIKKVLLKILQNSQENTCARASFLIKLQAEACNFIEKETLAQVYFPVNFPKFLRTPFLTEHLRWLLLTIVARSTMQNRSRCSHVFYKKAKELQKQKFEKFEKLQLENLLERHSSTCIQVLSREF